MTAATLNITVAIPATGALDPDTVARSIAKEALQQAAHGIGDTRRTAGELTHNFGAGNQVIGSWTFAPPA
jgi:hypothetical protein